MPTCQKYRKKTSGSKKYNFNEVSDNKFTNFTGPDYKTLHKKLLILLKLALNFFLLRNYYLTIIVSEWTVWGDWGDCTATCGEGGFTIICNKNVIVRTLPESSKSCKFLGEIEIEHCNFPLNRAKYYKLWKRLSVTYTRLCPR